MELTVRIAEKSGQPRTQPVDTIRDFTPNADGRRRGAACGGGADGLTVGCDHADIQVFERLLPQEQAPVEVVTWDEDDDVTDLWPNRARPAPERAANGGAFHMQSRGART